VAVAPVLITAAAEVQAVQAAEETAVLEMLPVVLAQQIAAQAAAVVAQQQTPDLQAAPAVQDLFLFVTLTLLI
jgi:hypothetical protein